MSAFTMEVYVALKGLEPFPLFHPVTQYDANSAFILFGFTGISPFNTIVKLNASTSRLL